MGNVIKLRADPIGVECRLKIDKQKCRAIGTEPRRVAYRWHAKLLII